MYIEEEIYIHKFYAHAGQVWLKSHLIYGLCRFCASTGCNDLCGGEREIKKFHLQTIQQSNEGENAKEKGKEETSKVHYDYITICEYKLRIYHDILCSPLQIMSCFKLNPYNHLSSTRWFYLFAFVQIDSLWGKRRTTNTNLLEFNSNGQWLIADPFIQDEYSSLLNLTSHCTMQMQMQRWEINSIIFKQINFYW